MSAPPAARIGTLVSWLTGTISSLTPRRLAYSSASTQAGPENCAPLPVVFSGSQGNSPIAAARSTPFFLIASTVLLAPGAGTPVGAASAGAMASAPAKTHASAPLRMKLLRSILTSRFGIFGCAPFAVGQGHGLYDAVAPGRPGRRPTVEPKLA